MSMGVVALEEFKVEICSCSARRGGGCGFEGLEWCLRAEFGGSSVVEVTG